MERVKRVEDPNTRFIRAQGIVGVGVSTRMLIAWSAAAGSPLTAAPGTPCGGSSWSPSRLSRGWCAASFGHCCSASALISVSPTRCGAHHGSSMSPPGAPANEPCSTTSTATSSASLSPMPGLSASMTKRSPSNTQNAGPVAHEPATSAALSSCAASSNTCCHAASTRCATLAYGIQHSVAMPPACARCCSFRRHRGTRRCRILTPRHSYQSMRSQYRQASRQFARTVRGG